MINEFVKKFEQKKSEIEAVFKTRHPVDYMDVVSLVIGILGSENKYESPDKERIYEINDGDYQGTLVYVIGANGYQPDKYWYVKVGYGSCSVCDTLEAIREYSNNRPTDEQVKDYMTLALHIIQGLKLMGSGDSDQ